MIEHLVPAMVEICGPDGVVTDPLDLRTYECDGLTSHRAAPGLVVLPRTAEQVAAVVRVCAGAGVPFVAPAAAPACPAARSPAPTGC
jgi:glycolate oxidase